ncbi:hypothetical protein U8335_19165 [Roseiconus lacunae]|nr:hypothetical protein U8335_19165 [Stieleria sp. HD01]
MRLEPLGPVVQDAEAWLSLSTHRTEYSINVVDGDLAVLIRVCVRVLFEPRAVGQHVDNLQNVDRRDKSITVNVRTHFTSKVRWRGGRRGNSEVSGE